MARQLATPLRGLIRASSHKNRYNKKMEALMRQYKHYTAFLLLTVTALLLSACGAQSTPVPQEPTPDLNAFATQVAGQVIAQITQTAAAYTPPPTDTPAATATPEQSPTPEATATPSKPAACDDAGYVSDVTVADGTQMTTGQQFTKTWKIKNTGTCTWAANYNLVFGYGEKMGGQPVALGAEVKPGETVDISVNLTAPTKAGNYAGAWRMANANGYPFGEFFTIVITVK